MECSLEKERKRKKGAEERKDNRKKKKTFECKLRQTRTEDGSTEFHDRRDAFFLPDCQSSNECRYFETPLD